MRAAARLRASSCVLICNAAKSGMAILCVVVSITSVSKLKSSIDVAFSKKGIISVCDGGKSGGRDARCQMSTL